MPEYIPKKRRIYLLNGLPPEVVAVAFAKTSRSPESFDVIAKELTEEKSSQFHEKWVVGYGHQSVAEHAVLSIAIENVSRYAVETIESNRLAAYTEKSSRYQIFTLNDFYIPEEIEHSPYKDLYTETCIYLLETYQRIQRKLEEYVKSRGLVPRKEGESDRGYEARVRAFALDRSRFLMPIAALANVGMTINARSLEHAITKMLSSPLSEVRKIGETLKEECRKVVPTLLKYVSPSPYLMETQAALGKLVESLDKDGKREVGEWEGREVLFSASSSPYPSRPSYSSDSVTLLDYDPEAEDKLVIALLYKFSHLSYQELQRVVKKMTAAEKERVIDEALRRLKDFDTPLRELEYIGYTFDCLMDYGAYFDLKRHRMCTQTPQEPTIAHGFVLPPLVEEAGLKEDFLESIRKAETAYERISSLFPQEARYLILNAHKRRMLWHMNLREVYHVVRLRSKPQGHFTYRKVAQEIYKLVSHVHPIIARYLQVNLEDLSVRPP
ncbi:MAG TPA: FAD-dependent thymidylate synthase [Candidatus Limnocylindrales bacterium]|nr:FAD-dependent thymidylate synthase [Candidatus Limnocylindrales bacterium]